MEYADLERSDEMLSGIEITKKADGLGVDNGTGAISRAEREALEGNEDLAQRTDEVITSPLILVDVDTDKDGNRLTDDGCGDGRGVNKTFTKDGELKHSLNRAKVFGGGAVMTSAIRIGLGEAEGRSLQQTMQDSIESLAEKGIDFGGHTDNHAYGEACGCGAIDKAPLIIEAAVRFADDIEGAMKVLDVDTQYFAGVMENYRTYAQSVRGQEYSGRKAMDDIINSGKIVKELIDDHKETRVLLNFVQGKTIDQEHVREMIDGRAQVFGVDVWRLQEIAQRLNTDENGTVDTVAAEKAFVSELVYTLATAAVLTKGDLPVYAVSTAHDQQRVATVA